jgi:hypothetical protein
MVDQASGKTGVRGATGTSPESPSVDRTLEDDEAHVALDARDALDSFDIPGDHTTEQLTAGLLRLHAERMQVLAREQRTRDRFTALHPEVPVVHVAALPGDVHDLAGLRAIGDRLATDGRTPAGAV